MSHDADSLTGLRGRRGLHLKKEGPKSWFYTIPEKGLGSYENLDENSSLLEMERQTFRGLKIHAMNILQKDFLFRVDHTFDIGKKEGQNPMTGKKDGQRSSYQLSSTVMCGNWDFSAAQVQNKQTILRCSNKGENHSFDVQGQILGSRSAFVITGEYKFKDMNFDALIHTGQYYATLGYTQPLTDRLGIGTNIEFHPTSDKATLGIFGKYIHPPTKSHGALSIKTGGGVEELSLAYAQETLPELNVIVASDLSLAKKSPFGGEKEWGSVLKGGYVYNGGYYQVKSLCDSSGSVTSMLQLIFAPESILMFCGNVC